ncbi:hypothetical protein VHEMI08717 [[Torrubiella] hemipterigena]|uniref:Siderophore biosynthesis n=1 Tax=[Torrubiella] hemipterigena TaxID=1531966 RepID=A0A0A1TP06_9HYPO|nr:hypothetical protein VHEMI08717 [[Torrubiella] hemipterigena]
MRTSDFLCAAIPLLMAASPVAAVSCEFHSFTTCEDRIVHWFDPDDGMICDPLDCGGGRAPVKTDVPGCAAYKGTLTRATSASYLSCFKKAGQATAPVVSPTPTVAAPSSKPVTTTAAPKPAETSKDVVAASSFFSGTASAVTLPISTTAAPSQSSDNSKTNSTGVKTQSASQSTSTAGAGKAVAGSFVIAAAAAIALL